MIKKKKINLQDVLNKIVKKKKDKKYQTFFLSCIRPKQYF